MRSILKGFLCLIVCGTVLYFVLHKPNYFNGSERYLQQGVHDSSRIQPRVLNISVYANSYMSKCIKATLKVPDRPKVPICVYDASEDMWVSGSILKQHTWEWDYVVTVWNLMKPVKDMAFLDLGCNIGAFTIPIARLGRRVIAVDANKENLKMLATSLHLGGLEENVTLIWNGVSNETKYVNLVPSERNVGGIQIKQSANQNPFNKDNTIMTIQLDDMLTTFGSRPFFMKMDIETHEAKALGGAGKFFQEIDVRFLLMEWVHYMKTNNTKEGSFITEFLSENSFRPCGAYDFKELMLEDAYSTWPNDILWIKK